MAQANMMGALVIWLFKLAAVLVVFAIVMFGLFWLARSRRLSKMKDAGISKSQD